MSFFTWFAKLIDNNKVEIPKNAVGDGTITNIFNVVLAAAGVIAVVVIIWAGIQFMIARGDPEKIKTARNSILYSVIGLIIVIFSFVILNFVIGKF